MNHLKTSYMTLLSLFMAIEIIMIVIPFLGFIPLGPLKATTLHIPVIIAGIILGKKSGVIIGLVFGIGSVIVNTFTPSLSSFVFSPFLSGSLLSIIIALWPRMMTGYVAGMIYQLFPYQSSLSLISSSFIASMTNTILVTSGIYFLFGTRYANVMNLTINQLLPYLLMLALIQGLLEAMVAIFIVVMVCPVLIKMR